MRQAIQICCLLVALSGFALAPSAASAQALELDRVQSLEMGRALLAQGRSEPALAIARALLQHNARDSDAQVLKAAALQQQGDFAGARRTAQRAHLRGDSAQTRFEAAMLAGRSEFQQDRHTRAQFWLRRAAQVAPDDEARALAERNFRQVRRLNPLELGFNLGLTNTSNINDGSSKEEIFFMNLPFQVQGSSRALSGTELRADFSLRYRVAQSARSESAVTLNALTRSYRLSSEAREQAPDVRASDFAFQQIEIGAVHRFVPEQGRSLYELSYGVGRSWYGGDKLSDNVRLSLSQTTIVRPRTSLQLAAYVQRQRRHDDSARSATHYGLSTELRHNLQNGGQLSFLVGGQRSEADSIQVRKTSLRTRLGYALPEPILNMRLSGSLELEQRRFPAGGFQPDGRRDTLGTLTVFAEFERLDYMGFRPVLQGELSRTWSNIPISERRAANLSLLVRSSF